MRPIMLWLTVRSRWIAAALLALPLASACRQWTLHLFISLLWILPSKGSAQEDPYAPVRYVLKKQGSCQPECSAQNEVQLPLVAPYKVRVEVMQIDMRSKEEFVEVAVGSQRMRCEMRAASDFDCSPASCGELTVADTSDRLQLAATAYKTHSTCKCVEEASPTSTQQVDEQPCYSALMSGLDRNFGLYVRFDFVPELTFVWQETGWSACTSEQCANATALSRRQVFCSAEGHAAAPPAASYCEHLPRPADSRLCSETEECALPALCDGCFRLHGLGDLGSGLKAAAADDTPTQVTRGQTFIYSPSSSDAIASRCPSSECVAKEVVAVLSTRDETPNVNVEWLSNGRTLWLDYASLRYRPSAVRMGGAPHSLVRIVQRGSGSGVSLMDCHGDQYLVRSNDTSRADALHFLERVADDGSPGFAERATFRISGSARQGYELWSGGLTLTSVAGQLIFKTNVSAGRNKVAHKFISRTQTGAEADCALPGDWNLCNAGDAVCCYGPTFHGDVDGCQLSWGSAATCGDNRCEQAAYALVESGSCEQSGCVPITSSEACSQAAATLRLVGDDVKATAKLASTSPAYCFWSTAGIGGGLWFNSRDSMELASDVEQPICACDRPVQAWSYAWVTGKWGSCSFACEKRHRKRSVDCVATYSDSFVSAAAQGRRTGKPVSDMFCLEAGLEKPPQREPCVTDVCFGMQVDMRCAGDGRVLDESEVRGLGKPLSNGVIGGEHCVEVAESDSERAAEHCRAGCVQLGDCIGFSLYKADRMPEASQAPHRCCFLKKATHWVTHFRGASCHLLQGAKTRSGCFCQVGWTKKELAGGDLETCGQEQGGCCATPGSGAVTWCPTTSPDCGAHLRGQQLWDMCDPDGMAVVTERTCSEHRHACTEAYCSSVRASARCAELAAALELDMTQPVSQLSMRMPSACVWQTATSQLWLNPVVTVSTTDGKKEERAPPASRDYPELCACKPRGFRWVAGEWGVCYRDSKTFCGKWKRQRKLWCLREKPYGMDGSGDIVQDSDCADLEEPAAQEDCSGCVADVLESKASFGPEVTADTESSKKNLLTMIRSEIAQAVGVAADRLRVTFFSDEGCCVDGRFEARLLLTDSINGSSPSAGDAMEMLQRFLLGDTSRSASARGSGKWYKSDSFGRFASAMTLKLLGVYSWRIASDWDACSAMCGEGAQKREVHCIYRPLLEGEPAHGIREEFCDAASKPASQRSCAIQPCEGCPVLKLGPHYRVQGTQKEALHDDVVYVTCAPEYSSADDVSFSEVRCRNGEWTAPEVSCGRPCDAHEVASGKYIVSGEGLLHGHSRQVVCSNHSSRAVESPPSSTVLCDNGAWTPMSLVCTRDCEEIALSAMYAVTDVSGSRIAGASHSYVRHGTSRRVACAENFTVASSNTDTASAATVRLRCQDGSWRGQEGLPDCKESCPPFELPDGYKVVEASAGDDATTTAVSVAMASSRQRMPHGSSLTLECDESHVRVQGAKQTLNCRDGQWSDLVMLCGQDCKPINASSPEFRRYSVVTEVVLTDAEGRKQTNIPGYGPGSVVSISCRGQGNPVASSSSSLPLAAENQEFIRCVAGGWTRPTLRCFNGCEAFSAGPSYSATLVGMPGMQEAGEDLVPHGAAAFVTCAKGYSPGGHSGMNSELVQPLGEPEELHIDSALCVDGHWTATSLKCLPDCPYLHLGPEYDVFESEGNKVNSTIFVRCSREDSEVVRLQCSETGIWLIKENLTAPQIPGNTENPEETQVPVEAFREVPHGARSISLSCNLPRQSFWGKLSEDEKALVLLLFLGLIGSLIGLGHNLYRLQPSGGCLGDLPWVNALRSASSRLSSSALATLGIAGFERSISEIELLQAPSCKKCDSRASQFICFPCGHLCLCIACAEEVNLFFVGGETTVACPHCGKPIDCVMDGKPASLFKTPPQQMPRASLLGRPASETARGRLPGMTMPAGGGGDARNGAAPTSNGSRRRTSGISAKPTTIGASSSSRRDDDEGSLA
eukprot:TRINITY_DN21087_c0_g1_i1.p1 TRINITY_DN21087_c0_g1~~TRINITY_DN21087_c0_g1_i1.p1  ORF type:complete len:1994 (-),score=348.45 TRINITY_DN21087_c0_g1_i1:160-6141(-)